MRQLDAPQPKVRNTPMRPRAWRALLDTPGAVTAEHEHGTLALVPGADAQLHLYWAFDGVEEMRLAFPAMFEELRSQIAAQDADHVSLDLVEVHGKEWLEPLLRDADFLFFAEWMEMVHPGIDPDVVPEFPEGVEMRRGTADDGERVRAIWNDAYGDLAEGPRTIDAHLDEASWLGVLEAEGEIVAFALTGEIEDAVGTVIATAVAPEAQGRGYGTLILQAAAYALAARDARQAVIRARPDIPHALRTCADAGFRPGRSGLEYRRPTDEDVIRERREARRITGVKARFGGWR